MTLDSAPCESCDHPPHVPVLPPSCKTEAVLSALGRSGVAVVEAVLDPDDLEVARRRLAEVARRERAAGCAVLEDGSAADGVYQPGVNQRVLSLALEDPVFAKLATNPQVLFLARAFLASAYPYDAGTLGRFGFDRVLLSSMTANIANPGGKPMSLHADQGFAPPGLPFPILLNVVLPLVDFTADNGATRVAPGSHVVDPAVLHRRAPATESVVAPAGAAVLVDGRTWHGTGENRTARPRPAILLNYCPPWVRPFANHPLDTDPAFLETASSELLGLLGYEPWFVFGASEARQLIRRAPESASGAPRCAT